MNNLQTFNELIGKTAYIALATAKDNAPNVRIMTIWYNFENKGVIYFPAARDSAKIDEFAHNSKVAFTTLDFHNGGLVRVKSATVQKSSLTVDDIEDGIAKNDPIFAHTLKRMGKDIFDVYEAHFDKAYLTVGANENIEVTL